MAGEPDAARFAPALPAVARARARFDSDARVDRKDSTFRPQCPSERPHAESGTTTGERIPPLASGRKGQERCGFPHTTGRTALPVHVAPRLYLLLPVCLGRTQAASGCSQNAGAFRRAVCDGNTSGRRPAASSTRPPLLDPTAPPRPDRPRCPLPQHRTPDRILKRTPDPTPARGSMGSGNAKRLRRRCLREAGGRGPGLGRQRIARSRRVSAVRFLPVDVLRLIDPAHDPIRRVVFVLLPPSCRPARPAVVTAAGVVGAFRLRRRGGRRRRRRHGRPPRAA